MPKQNRHLHQNRKARRQNPASVSGVEQVILIGSQATG